MYSTSISEENDLRNNDDSISKFINSNNEIRYIKLNLYSNIYTEFNNNNYKNIAMSSISESNKSDKTIDDKYFETHEQINEVKVNLFLILSKNFRLNSSKYPGFLVKGNKIKTKRLVVQKFKLIKDENRVEFGPKQYIFLPGQSKSLFFHMRMIAL